MSPIFRVKFYIMSKFSLTDELSTIIKPHHRISRLEGAFQVEESSRSPLRESQQGLAQLLFRNCECATSRTMRADGWERGAHRRSAAG